MISNRLRNGVRQCGPELWRNRGNPPARTLVFFCILAGLLAFCGRDGVRAQGPIIPTQPTPVPIQDFSSVPLPCTVAAVPMYVPTPQGASVKYGCLMPGSFAAASTPTDPYGNLWVTFPATPPIQLAHGNALAQFQASDKTWRMPGATFPGTFIPTQVDVYRNGLMQPVGTYSVSFDADGTHIVLSSVTWVPTDAIDVRWTLLQQQ